MTTAVLALQTASGMADRETLLVIFVGIIAICVLGLTLGLVGALIALLKVKKDAERAVERLKEQAMAKAQPLINQATVVMREATPKVRTVAEDLAEIVHVVRAQVTDLDSTLSDATSKARSQVDRVNGMLTSTLDTTAEVVSNLHNGIRVPIREVSGVLSGLRAGLGVLTGRNDGPVRSQVRQAAHSASTEGRVTAMKAEGEAREAQAHVDRFTREVSRSADEVRSSVNAGAESSQAEQPELLAEVGPVSANDDIVTASGSEIRERPRY